jgi:valyl-tRNA synthetase
MVGKLLELPLTGRTIPVIADSYVDAAFGSGCVKITPAHDFNDYEVGVRHDLPQINIFTPDAKINDNGPAPYRGLDRFEARKKIVADLEAAGLIEKIEPHKLMVPKGDRTGAVIEPYLTDQWYVKIAPLAGPALEAVEQGRTRFVPENWSKTYYEWMRNIKDWCVSRQLWWGHRIPAWYDEAGHIYVGRDEAEVRKQHALAAGVTLRQDEDVLDTWFSSALWPFSTLGWPDTTPELNRFYPGNVLITGFDIIFFWVARMMMMGLKFMGEVPFRDVYITGLILDEQGDKMSKAKGNIIDPLDIVDGITLDALLAKRTTGLMQPQMKQRIEANTRKQFPQGMEAHGTDALRFTMASLAGPSREINFNMGRVAGNRNFCNKLWNASRFVMMTVEDQGDLTGEAELSVADRWIVSRFSAMLAQLDQNLRDYRFDLATSALYEFTWYEFCDWYLELTKPVLQGENSTAAQKRGTRRTLITTLEALLRALHPLIPFITEEIWQRVHPIVAPLQAATHFRGAPQPADLLMLAPFPQSNDFAADAEAEAEVARLKQLILGMRQARSGMNLAPSLRLAVQYHSPSQSEIDLTEKGAAYALRLAGLASLTLTPPEKIPVASSSIIVGSTTFSIPMKGLIEPQAEAARVTRLIANNKSDIGKLTAKLGNARYTENAKPELVAADQARLAELIEQTAGYERHLEKVHKLAATD